ncbi:MAG: hypothetical protein ACK5RS_16205 [Acidobacteriota bacterium]
MTVRLSQVADTTSAFLFRQASNRVFLLKSFSGFDLDPAQLLLHEPLQMNDSMKQHSSDGQSRPMINDLSLAIPGNPGTAHHFSTQHRHRIANQCTNRYLNLKRLGKHYDCIEAVSLSKNNARSALGLTFLLSFRHQYRRNSRL